MPVLSRVLVTLDLPTPLYYCSGEDAVDYDSQIYTPRVITAPKIRLAEMRSMGWYIVITDEDWSLYDDLDANVTDWGNFEVDFKKVIRVPGAQSWTLYNQITMTKTDTNQNMNNREMKINLSAVVGNNKRACLTEGSRTNFSLAPSPQDVISIGDRQTRFPAGSRSRHEPPGGEERRYSGGGWRNGDPRRWVADDPTPGPQDIDEAIQGPGDAS